MSQFSIAIVGYGTVTTAHITALQRIHNVKISAIVSHHLTQKEYDRTKPYGDLRVFNTLDALLAEDAQGGIHIDVVDICNRPDLHAENALKAIHHRKHLIIEKPIALNIEECYAIERAAATQGVQVCVCFECRFSEQFIKTKQAIAEYLGEVRTCSVAYAHGIGPSNPQFLWNIQKRSGGDSFLSAGCHALDGALFFMNGEVESVYSVATHQPHADYIDYEYDPIQHITIQFKDGRFATVSSNIAHHGPYAFPIQIDGTEGSLDSNKVYTAKQEQITLDMKLLSSGEVGDHPYFEQFSTYFAALSENKPMQHTSLSDAIKTHEVMHLAKLSLQFNRKVSMSEIKPAAACYHPLSLIPQIRPTKIIITGATSGIGLSLAEHFAEQGFIIVAIGRRDELLQALRDKYPENIIPIMADITKSEGRANIKAVLTKQDTRCVLVHNAGIAYPRLIESMTEEEFDLHHALHVKAPLFLTQLLLPHLRNGGRILQISSGLAHNPMPAMSAYGSSKAALFRLKDYFNEEFKQLDIHCGSAMPGVVDTPIQTELRACSTSQFPSVNAFHGFFQRGELLKPQTAAKFLSWLLLSVENERFTQGDWNIYDKGHQVYWAAPEEVVQRQKTSQEIEKESLSNAY
jgi:UDP-N-acetyl-2-amino-2-deoxyglucuronate dehydrogenase